MNNKFYGIKALVEKINPENEKTKEAITKFLRLYSELYDKR